MVIYVPTNEVHMEYAENILKSTSFQLKRYLVKR